MAIDLAVLQYFQDTGRLNNEYKKIVNNNGALDNNDRSWHKSGPFFE